MGVYTHRLAERMILKAIHQGDGGVEAGEGMVDVFKERGVSTVYNG